MQDPYGIRREVSCYCQCYLGSKPCIFSFTFEAVCSHETMHVCELFGVCIVQYRSRNLLIQGSDALGEGERRKDDW